MGFKKKNKSPITDDIFFILNTIEKHGHEAKIVGGAVRNFLLEIEISDIDIATTAVPSEIIDIFQSYNIKTIPSGINHGTVTVIYHRKAYEITTLRKDVKTFGRKAEVVFTKSFEIDSNRRDFTINAIYMDKNSNLFDYHNGIADISKKNIKFIGNPEERITEDYLRMLRYFRFVVKYAEFKCNEKYIELMNSLKHNISVLSSERITSELLKIFEIANSYKIIPFMRFILDELFELQCDPLNVISKLKINNVLSAEERLSMLLKFSKIPVEQLILRYNFSRNIKEILKLTDINFNISSIKNRLKMMKKKHRIFYINYIVIKMFFQKVPVCNLKSLNNQLINFCNSEYVDFNFKANSLSKYKLSSEELKNVMIVTKKFWLESENDVNVDDCLNFALKLINEY